MWSPQNLQVKTLTYLPIIKVFEDEVLVCLSSAFLQLKYPTLTTYRKICSSSQFERVDPMDTWSCDSGPMLRQNIMEWAIYGDFLFMVDRTMR